MRTQSTQSDDDNSRASDEQSRLELRIRVIGGPSAGLELLMHDEPVVAGSSRSCDLHLADPTVSRRHARFQVVGQRIRVEDLGSRNGTRFLGAAITQVEVPVGATLQLGRSLLSFLPAERVDTSITTFGEVRTRSPKMKAVFEAIERAAQTEVPVLLEGETGVGKSLLARTLHQRSRRGSGPFVAVQCSSLSAEPGASRLFGVRRAAQADVAAQEDGALLQARSGTLFLDDVGDLPAELQPLLVRCLDEKMVTPPDGSRPRPSDFRLVATTSRDLRLVVEGGGFRKELFHRLTAVVIRVPPLRERPEDIPLLAREHLTKVGRAAELTPSTLAWMSTYPWPGNVRELQNAVERLAVLGSAEAIPEWGLAERDERFHEARRAFEKSYLLALLDKHRALTDAAKASGLSRAHLYRLLAAHGLRRPDVSGD